MDPQATTVRPGEQFLPLSAKWNRPSGPAHPACSPSRGRWPVAPLARALRVPSHLGPLPGSPSFAAEPTFFAAEPTAFAAEPTARAEPVHRQFLASTAAT